jgi:twinkle protein
MCHNCDWHGRTKDNERRSERRRRVRPPSNAVERPTVEVMRWFADRGINPDVVERNKIGFKRQHWVGGAHVPAICFQYFRQGELINVKCRALASKTFAQEKDAESILYGLDDIANLADTDAVIIVEGECDKLALEVAGYRHVISVPDGAPQRLKDEPSANDAKFEYLRNCETELDAIKHFVLAVDNDAPGRVLEEELARRLGKERCWRVRWPDSNDIVCKDANEVLIHHGPEVLRECIAAAEPYPITGLYPPDAYFEDVWALFAKGQKRGLRTGFAELDKYMTIAAGQLSLVTGIPNHGKSEFIDALTVNLAHDRDNDPDAQPWVTALCSFENQPGDHIVKLAEKHIGAPFWEGPTRARMTEFELQGALDWVEQHYVFIRTEENVAATIDWILEKARAAVFRYGATGLVIDPYNEIEHQRPAGMTETEYVSQLLAKLKRFGPNHGVHVWIVAHPVKMQRDKDGVMPAPTLYDVSGSANWLNKCDVGIVVHRDYETSKAQIYVQKVRDKWVGQQGEVTLNYDRATGRYSQPGQSSASPARDDQGPAVKPERPKPTPEQVALDLLRKLIKYNGVTPRDLDIPAAERPQSAIKLEQWRAGWSHGDDNRATFATVCERLGSAGRIVRHGDWVWMP